MSRRRDGRGRSSWSSAGPRTSAASPPSRPGSSGPRRPQGGGAKGSPAADRRRTATAKGEPDADGGGPPPSPASSPPSSRQTARSPRSARRPGGPRFYPNPVPEVRGDHLRRCGPPVDAAAGRGADSGRERSPPRSPLPTSRAPLQPLRSRPPLSRTSRAATTAQRLRRRGHRGGRVRDSPRKSPRRFRRPRRSRRVASGRAVGLRLSRAPPPPPPAATPARAVTHAPAPALTDAAARGCLGHRGGGTAARRQPPSARRRAATTEPAGACEPAAAASGARPERDRR